jgi:membrane protease YdiL (CAAX protease family)
VRWGIGDAIAAFAVGAVGSALIGLPIIDANHPNRPTPVLVLVVVQNLLIVGWLVMVARRKGLGSLHRDFGFEFPAPGRPWYVSVGWFCLGSAVLIATNLLLWPLSEIYGRTAKQGIVKTFEQAQGWHVVALAVAICVLAPIGEELLFRGVLLRSFLRRWSASTSVLVSALVFGAVHPLFDPNVGSLIALPAILLLGLISGAVAVRSGNIGRSILLHMGFNSLTILAILLSLT